MEDDDYYRHDKYEAQPPPPNLSKMQAFHAQGCPPAGMDVVPVLSLEGSAVSAPEQLQGILCLDEPPETVQTTTKPESGEEGRPQPVSVFSIPWRHLRTLKEERAVVEDGPRVVFDGEPRSMHDAPPRFKAQVVRALIPSAYPPRSLNHVQTCDATRCRLFPSEPPKHIEPAAPEGDSTRPTTPVVFTTELLEIILSHLDMKTRLISASRVCKFWLATISKSPLLQRASFFEPERPSSSEEPPRMNPLLAEAFGETFFNQGQERPPHRRAEWFWKLPFSPPALHKMQAPDGSVLKAEPSCRQRSFTRAGASWRRMLVSQPPPPFLGFVWTDDHPRQPRQRVRADSLSPPGGSSSPAGVTMGLVYDTVQCFSMQTPYHEMFFRVRWDVLCQRKAARGSSSLEQGGSALEATKLAVCFWNDEYFLGARCGPLSMEATRGVFKCEEAARPSFAGEASISDSDEQEMLQRPSPLGLWEPLILEPPPDSEEEES